MFCAGAGAPQHHDQYPASIASMSGDSRLTSLYAWSGLFLSWTLPRKQIGGSSRVDDGMVGLLGVVWPPLMERDGGWPSANQ